MLGLGFMGRVHARCYQAHPLVEIVAVVDADTQRSQETLRELGLDIPLSDHLGSILHSVPADALDICLPTDAHVEAAEAAFSAGLHVFCEKPIALDLEGASRINDAATRASRQLMVGQTLRFWPEYTELARMLRSEEAGPLRALNLFRRAPRPNYTTDDWTGDPGRCLGAALDLHIHDTDLTHFLLGPPDRVCSQAIQLPTGWDHIQTQYIYEDGPLVFAEGGWTYPNSRTFQMGYSALFESGSLDFDNTATPTLMKNVKGETIDLSSLPEKRAGGPLEGLEGYYNQIEYFVERLLSRKPIEINTGTDATMSLRTVLAEIQSARTQQIISLAD